MSEPLWIGERTAPALHNRLLVLHGGAAGVRDTGCCSRRWPVRNNWRPMATLPA